MKIGCSARITTMFEVQKLLWMPNQMAGTMSNSIIKLSGIFDILTTINNSTRPAETYIRILSSAYGQSRRNYLRITFSRPCDERDMSNFSTRKTHSNSGCSFEPHYTKRHENLDMKSSLITYNPSPNHEDGFLAFLTTTIFFPCT
jgi:hypothetical protein